MNRYLEFGRAIGSGGAEFHAGDRCDGEVLGEESTDPGRISLMRGSSHEERWGRYGCVSVDSMQFLQSKFPFTFGPESAKFTDGRSRIKVGSLNGDG